VYFSADDQWDIDDKLLATVPHTGGLIQGQVYSGSVDVLVPGAVPGDYYVIVRADLYNQEKEAGQEGNNVVAFGPIPLNVRELTTDAVPVNGILSDTDREDYYAVSTPAGEDLSIVLDGLAPDAGSALFASYETIPTRLDYDYRGALDLQGQQRLVVGQTLPGTYYVLVYGDPLSGASAYELTADFPTLTVTDITPDKHGVGTDCTMTVRPR
jgi:hypothetical protein